MRTTTGAAPTTLSCRKSPLPWVRIRVFPDSGLQGESSPFVRFVLQ